MKLTDNQYTLQTNTVSRGWSVSQLNYRVFKFKNCIKRSRAFLNTLKHYVRVTKNHEPWTNNMFLVIKSYTYVHPTILFEFTSNYGMPNRPGTFVLKNITNQIGFELEFHSLHNSSAKSSYKPVFMNYETSFKQEGILHAKFQTACMFLYKIDKTRLQCTKSPMLHTTCMKLLGHTVRQKCNCRKLQISSCQKRWKPSSSVAHANQRIGNLLYCSIQFTLNLASFW